MVSLAREEENLCTECRLLLTLEIANQLSRNYVKYNMETLIWLALRYQSMYMENLSHDRDDGFDQDYLGGKVGMV